MTPAALYKQAAAVQIHCEKRHVAACIDVMPLAGLGRQTGLVSQDGAGRGGVVRSKGGRVLLKRRPHGPKSGGTRAKRIPADLVQRYHVGQMS